MNLKEAALTVTTPATSTTTEETPAKPKLPSNRKLWVAVDVKGTLDGSNSENVTKFVRWLMEQGHNVIVWSNLYSFALDHAKLLGTAPQEKRRRGQGMSFDVAIDDEVSDQGRWLAADFFLWSQDVPSDQAEYQAFLNAAIPQGDIE